MMPIKLPRIYSSGFDRSQSIFYFGENLLYTGQGILYSANRLI